MCSCYRTPGDLICTAACQRCTFSAQIQCAYFLLVFLSLWAELKRRNMFPWSDASKFQLGIDFVCRVMHDEATCQHSAASFDSTCEHVMFGAMGIYVC